MITGAPSPSCRGWSVSRVLNALRALVDGAAELLWPTRCVGCDRPGTLLCDDCRAALPRIDPAYACPHCGAPFGSLVCTECIDVRPHQDDACDTPEEGPGRLDEAFRPLDGIACFGVHEWPLDIAVRAYKDAGERRLAPLLAELAWQASCESAAFDLKEVDAVVFVPDTAQAYARRGFDHMEPIARAFCALSNKPLVDALARQDAGDQRRRGRRERLARAGEDCVCLADLTGMAILVLDDVLTTGATVCSAALACRAAGAAKVYATCVVRAW